MAAPKYLKRDASSGRITEVAATETGPTSEVIVSTTSGGTIDPSLLPASGAATAVTGEALVAGAFVYIKASDGKLYNATWSSGGHPAIGYVILAYPTPGSTATYYPEGTQNTGLTGLTTGDYYYGDSTTPGGVTTSVPSGTGVIQQRVGMAVSTTALEVMFGDEIVLA